MLDRIRDLPMDRVKIDRTVVRGATGDGASLLAAMIGMAHSLGLEAVAEGVETQPELDLLARHGCDTVQGFLISRPVPPAEIEGLLRATVIEDFGTRYSSLTYLRRFPIDAVKIDRSFVAGVARQAQDRAIVRAVVELAHALEMLVIAEGVETPEQFLELRRLGADRAQGYLIGRPSDAAAAEALLQRDGPVAIALGRSGRRTRQRS